MKTGEPEYAIVPWVEYQKLLKAARKDQNTETPVAEPEAQPETVTEPQPHPLATIAQQLSSNQQQPSSAAADAPFSGNKVRELREQKGMDSKTLARGIGISPSYLAQIESGERMPGDAIWHNIARELQVQQDALKVTD